MVIIPQQLPGQIYKKKNSKLVEITVGGEDTKYIKHSNYIEYTQNTKDELWNVYKL